MTEDIWAGKPDPKAKKYQIYWHTGESAFNDDLYLEDENAWLEKLKAHYRKPVAVLQQWERHFGEVTSDFKLGHDMKELLEKAEKLEALKEYVEHPFFVFFKEMVETYNHHVSMKGESWRKCSWGYLTDELMKQLEDMQTDPDRENYMANIGNYAAMIRLKEIMEAEG